MAEVVGPRLLTAHRSRETGLVPDTVEHLPTVAAVTWLPAAEVKNVPRVGPNRARVIRSQSARTSLTSPVIGDALHRLGVTMWPTTTISVIPTMPNNAPSWRTSMAVVPTSPTMDEMDQRFDWLIIDVMIRASALSVLPELRQ
jgi:hypothetical protein